MQGRENAIYGAAVRLFKAKGYHATSVQELADAVGLQKGSLYHYMSGKEDLLFEITRTAIEGYLQGLEAIRGGAGTAREKLCRLVDHHVERVCRDTDTITVLLREGHALRGAAQEKVLALTSRYTQGVASLVQEGVADGTLATPDPPMAALVLLGSLNWIPQWYRRDGRLSPEEIAQRVKDVLLAGLAPR